MSDQDEYGWQWSTPKIDTSCKQISGELGHEGERGHIDLEIIPSTGYCSLIAQVQAGGDGELLGVVGRALMRLRAAQQESPLSIWPPSTPQEPTK